MMKSKAKGRRMMAFLLSAIMGFSNGAAVSAEESGYAAAPAGIQEKQLDCPLNIHQHTAECYDTDDTLVCGIADYVIHVHNEDCYDADGGLVCQLPQVETHEHTQACYEEQRKLVCSMEENGEHQHDENCYETQQILICEKEQVIAHTHTDACRDENGVLSCGLLQAEEHIHSGECFQNVPAEDAGENSGDVQDEESQVDDPISTPPGQQENAAAAVTVTNEDSTNANVTPWTDDTGDAQKHLQTALFAVDQGYTIQSVEYYRIDGFTGSTATVKYSGGGLSAAADGAKVFVYDLGVDGVAAPQSCTVKNEAKENDLFTSFDFEFLGESKDALHIYAFISAAPAELEEMGIYLGKEQSDGTWVAYDGATEQDANVKATITLPTPAPDGYCPFIRKINAGEGFYPNADAVHTKAGEFNGWQCYTIRWIKQEAGRLSMLPLNKNGSVTVEIEYLKDEARLSGPAGARKLLIFNSDTDGSLVDQVADTVKNVQVEGDYYKRFTFEAAQAGPYVFVSKKVERGYIQALGINNIIDGSAPFDTKDKPGNDSGPDNRIVRSYDTIQYTLDATFGARQESVTEKEVDMYFELTLRKSATAARFDVSKMLWLGQDYGIEYLDENDDVIMVMAHDGKYYLPQKDENGAVIRNEYGFVQADTTKGVSMNAQVSGSTAGSESYKVDSGGVVMQRLVGRTRLRANDGESILNGTQKFSMAVEVRNADNDEIFAPSFKMWLEGNEENYGPETTSTGGGLEPAQPILTNVVDINADKQYQVTVSAGTNFNVQLKKNTDMSYKNWFDFSTGKAVAEPARTELVRLANLTENHGKSNPAEFTENDVGLSEEKRAEYANYRYGRITCYGIALQLYNDTEKKDDREAKGLKGLSLPVGNITFDLNFSSEATAGETALSPDEYTAILWDYNENIPAYRSFSDSYVDPGRGTLVTPGDGLGNGGRNIYWDGEIRSPYAKGAAPSNYKVYHDGCYYGGDWSLVDEEGKEVNSLEKLNQIASPTVVEGSGGDAIYHFSVGDYDFDFDNQHFPARNAGNSNNVPGYNTYALCFSAGCVQVLSVFPMVQEVREAEIFLNTTVSNLHLTTRAGQELKAENGDGTKIQHEVNTEDNAKKDQIVLYAPGGMIKGSSFNGLYEKKHPWATNVGFLGTDYWTTSYDCSTFAGDEIWLISYGMISAGSDYRTRSMNLLQLFDSRALSIRDDPDVCQEYDEQYDNPGRPAFLYAADPDYPKGYDTNHKDADNKYDVLAYMNEVREEDLKYYTSLKELKADSYTCVGVLMELRGCDLLGGKYQYMRIPVKVNGDDQDLVGKTVATVNTFRVWSEELEDITWADGEWNASTGKNELKGFPKPTNTYDGNNYSGELVNGGDKLANGSDSPLIYIKTEYQDNLQVKGTHAGGTPAGNSLLILNYKAGINIGVDNKASTGMISYNLGNGETVVDYRLKNIRTEVSASTGQTDRPITELTINTVLDEGYTGATQRISVSGGSYRISGYAVDAGGNAADEETSMAISTDPDHPTVLEFDDSDGKRYRIKVHAQPGPNSQSVKFVIQDAPVGIQLPDITFQANFAAVTALKNNDTIKTTTYISGTSDNRAYDPTKGNTDNVTVGIVMLSGTNLTKAVNKHYMELNDVITYDVTYTNSGTDKIDKIYFYDLLPHNEDIRGSKFDGEVVLRGVDVTSSKENGALPADATVYYSTIDYTELYDKVKVFGGTMAADGTVTGMDEQKVEKMLETKDFGLLGRVTDGEFKYDDRFHGMTEDEKIAQMSKVTGLYVKVENLQRDQTVDMKITVQTRENKADDWYKNIANSWIAGSKTLPLTSNKVETQTVSRSISGVVWYDFNLDGIRNDDEPLLKDVEVTLFKKDGEKYMPCEKDVTGEEISMVITGEDGAYSFDKLSQGDYIVAFSGKVLDKFTGAATYQQNGKNDGNTNDGKAIEKGKQYAYYIRYSADSPSMPLHSLDGMKTVSLVNGVEMYSNQDLGLINAGDEMPETGGMGTLPYTVGGILLILAALPVWSFTRRRKQCR